MKKQLFAIAILVSVAGTISARSGRIHNFNGRTKHTHARVQVPVTGEPVQATPTAPGVQTPQATAKAFAARKCKGGKCLRHKKAMAFRCAHGRCNRPAVRAFVKAAPKVMAFRRCAHGRCGMKNRPAVQTVPQAAAKAVATKKCFGGACARRKMPMAFKYANGRRGIRK